MYELIICCLDGIGITKDETQAAMWICQLCVAAYLDSPNAKELLQKLAPEEAAHLYKLAAEVGNLCAMYELGKCYLEGIGVDKDEEQAAKWLCRAAEKGNTDAKEQLQKLAPEKAVHLYRIAAESGDTYAKYALGKCYLDGIGIAKDETQAGERIYKAAREGNTDAKDLLYRLAAERGHAAAQYALGACYYNGYGVDKDRTEAVKWYRPAADQGYAQAQFDLGVCYAKGEGVNKDEQQAKQWLQKAADNGEARAKELLRQLGQK